MCSQLDPTCVFSVMVLVNPDSTLYIICRLISPKSNCQSKRQHASCHFVKSLLVLVLVFRHQPCKKERFLLLPRRVWFFNGWAPGATISSCMFMFWGMSVLDQRSSSWILWCHLPCWLLIKFYACRLSCVHVTCMHTLHTTICIT